jgi:phosphatidylcholine synthase
VRARAFSVHVFTASGAALGFLALIAAVAAQWSLMFAWLGLALIVDAVDGTFARRLKVAERLPRWSGDTLDLVVDFVTYVFVPAYAIVSSGLMPTWLALPAGVVIVVTSGLYFADRRMKMLDNYFRGFPALWNLAAFYLLLLRPDPWTSAAVVAILAALSFVPFPFVHPVRVARLRKLRPGTGAAGDLSALRGRALLPGSRTVSPRGGHGGLARASRLLLPNPIL